MDTTQGQRQASDAITGAAQTFAPESYTTYFEDVFYPQASMTAPSVDAPIETLVSEPPAPTDVEFVAETSVVASAPVVSAPVV
jgi:hypothetical protein